MCVLLKMDLLCSLTKIRKFETRENLFHTHHQSSNHTDITCQLYPINIITKQLTHQSNTLLITRYNTSVLDFEKKSRVGAFKYFALLTRARYNEHQNTIDLKIKSAFDFVSSIQYCTQSVSSILISKFEIANLDPILFNNHKSNFTTIENLENY